MIFYYSCTFRGNSCEEIRTYLKNVGSLNFLQVPFILIRTIQAKLKNSGSYMYTWVITVFEQLVK